VNSSSSRLYYTYETNGQKLEVTAVMESSKYQLGGSSDVISGDGGTLASVYEKGSVTGLEPLDYGDSSLVGYWTFDEGQSSTAYDSSGNNATGSWSGTQAGTNGYYSPGKIGSWAGYFNATDDYVNVTNTSFNLSSSGYTFSEWLNLATSSASANPALMGISSGANIGFYLESAGTGYNIKPWAGGSAQVFATNTPFSSWHLVTVTYAGYGSLLRTVYVDGVSAGTESDGSMGAWSGVRIGYNQYYPSVVPSGLIDDVRIYNRALSAAQIAAMYNAGK
jgi:hypothetical protein